MTALVEARTRAALAEKMLAEVAGLEPDLRDSLVRLLDESLRGAEELLQLVLELFKGGAPPGDAPPGDADTVGRLMIRNATLLGGSIELVASRNPELEQWEQQGLARLAAIKEQALRMIPRPVGPRRTHDLERINRSLEQAARGEGMGTEEILAELRNE
jgi:hypothetical protein